MPTALIAEDEDLPRAELRRMLQAAWPELTIVAEAEHGPAAIEALEQHRPDVAWLDIRMPGCSGLDVARAASGRCHVVFTTAYDAHAIEAFEAGAVDYLLKPVDARRLTTTVERLKARLQPSPDAAAPPADLQALIARLSSSRPSMDGGVASEPNRLRWISASAGDAIKLLAVDEVLFFQSDEKYTRVVTAADEALVRKPLREIAEGLDGERFWQVHRGVIVRADAIARVHRDELGRLQVVLRQHGERLPVSQAYAWRFKPM